MYIKDHKSRVVDTKKKKKSKFNERYRRERVIPSPVGEFGEERCRLLIERECVNGFRVLLMLLGIYVEEAQTSIKPINFFFLSTVLEYLDSIKMA